MSFPLFNSLYRSQITSERHQHSSKAAGFSLLELIVVVLIIAILSAIIAPGWLAFVNRQRVAKVNDAVFSAMQEAQREAKRTKLSYHVSFKGDPLEVAVYPEGTTTLPWQPLSEGLDIKDGQVILCSNIAAGTANKNSGSITCGGTGERTITFDYQGNLKDDANLGSTAPQVLAVTAAIPQSNNAQQAIPATARCVMVKTLIGSMQIGQDEYDTTSNPQGCPL